MELKSKKSIKTWAEEDRPREKLIEKGIEALTNAELIAILLNSGNKKESAVDLAKKILQTVENNLSELGKLSIEDLKQFDGIGDAKAISVIAALELGRRRKLSDVLKTTQIKSSTDVFNVFYPKIGDIIQEEFWVMYLNRNNKILKTQRISIGGVAQTVVDAKIIFKHAVQLTCSGLILAHNHPSGNLKPSQQDIAITDKINNAAKYFDMKLLDHIIVSGKNYYSFADNGIIKK